jgi:hypothetical protein
MKESAGFLRSKRGSGRANDTGGGNRVSPVSHPVDSRSLNPRDGEGGGEEGPGAELGDRGWAVGTGDR